VPDANGKLQLQDYDLALTGRGFDGYQPADRAQMINLGYRYLARRYPWNWELSNITYTVAPGSGSTIQVSGLGPLGAQNVDRVLLTTDPWRKALKVMRQEVFDRKWLPLDLTNPQNWTSAPDWYYVYNGLIYILAPAQTSISVTVYFKQYLVDMVNATDTPATPQILDEVLLDCALVRCHTRAQELQLAQAAQTRVESAIGDMLANDVWLMGEQQERVVPDNQWL
jgi:hypothetical protein